ncbi:hypothetical protein NLJ89_g3441 [Agrocybe chaxingu]|uniref:WW domain-containing protein n=1 Tax=Agrocybe chaxingu TaxID=84603 RepID=A0A9W8K4Q8_9AGAR|nr:hypothetical protein NLJ89_g3441 [Agrocybe chaxingu]
MSHTKGAPNEVKTKTDASEPAPAPPQVTNAPSPTPRTVYIKLVPTTPFAGHRFMEREKYSYCFDKPVFLPPGPHGGGATLNDDLFGTPLPDGWTEYIHPDGLPYFHHEQWGVVTEMDVRDFQQRRHLEIVHEIIMTLFQEVDEAQGGKLSKEPYELYISNRPKHRYYFIRHKTQEVFWLDQMRLGVRFLGDTDDAEGANYGECSLHGRISCISNTQLMRTIAILIRNLYYAHLTSFPCHSHVPEDGIQFLHGYLAYIAADDMTTHFKATPWDPQSAATLLDMLDRMISRGPDRTANGFKTFFIAQLLATVCKYSSSLPDRHLAHDSADKVRAWHRHGTQAAINEQRLSPLPTMGPVDAVVRIFSELASEREWSRLMTTLITEWSDTNLLATVTLSANTAFLALNLSGIARTSSIASTLFAIGSIVIGLHHVWKHRDQREARISELSFYIQNTGQSATDIRRLALLLSLPMIFLLWALLAFTCAVANFAFNPPKAVASYVVPACVLAVICALGIVTNVVFWNVFKYKRGRYTPRPVK